MIEIHNLDHRYDSAPVLRDISITINKGEWCLIVGPNGSGKTTLIHHFTGLLEPDSGSVRIDGRDPVEDPLHARTRIGMVFQLTRNQFVDSIVYDDVAFGPENLGVPRDEIDQRVRSSLRAVGMLDRIDAEIEALSAGEQARIAIAGALSMNARYLVLDEPFARLDWPSRRTILEHLDSLHQKGTGIILVTHDIRDLLRRADRVIGLHEGRIAFNAPPMLARSQLPSIEVRDPKDAIV